jgi:hypothetical protein
MQVIEDFSQHFNQLQNLKTAYQSVHDIHCQKFECMDEEKRWSEESSWKKVCEHVVLVLSRAGPFSEIF